LGPRPGYEAQGLPALAILDFKKAIEVRPEKGAGEARGPRCKVVAEQLIESAGAFSGLGPFLTLLLT